MRTSVIKLGISAMLLLFTVGTVMAASIQVVSIGPEKIHAGKKTTITVKIQNDSNSACRVTLESSAPQGCSLTPLQPDIVSFRGYCTPTVPANGRFDAQFECSFNGSNLAGAITWTIKEYGRVSDGPQLGDAKTQTIVPKVGKDYWENKFKDRLKAALETNTGGYRDVLKKLYNLCEYDNGSADEVSIATVDGSSDTWEDGYNISRMKARLVFNWHRSFIGTRNWTKLTVVFNMDQTGQLDLDPKASTVSDISDSTIKPVEYTEWAAVATAFAVAVKAVVITAAAAGS